MMDSVVSKWSLLLLMLLLLFVYTPLLLIPGKLTPTTLYTSEPFHIKQPPAILKQFISEIKRNRAIPAVSCSAGPITKIGFAKTHKTASSTIQNILMRFGMNSGWNFVLPSAGSHLGPPRHQYQLTVPYNSSWYQDSAANRLIGEVVQSRRRPLLGPSPG